MVKAVKETLLGYCYLNESMIIGLYWTKPIKPPVNLDFVRTIFHSKEKENYIKEVPLKPKRKKKYYVHYEENLLDKLKYDSKYYKTKNSMPFVLKFPVKFFSI